MARKLAAMDRMGYDSAAHEQPNHRYRYLANLGTFHAHRWFKNGANRDDMADMQLGRDLIAQAIKENPDAHFGREKYQLMAMEWVIELDPSAPPADDEEKRRQHTFLCIDPSIGVFDSSQSVLPDYGVDDAITGITGLIVMGAAWESLDAFKALALALKLDGRTSFAKLADARAWEIGYGGGETLVPRSWLVEYRAESRPKIWMNLWSVIPNDTKIDLEASYVEWRQAAEGWRWQRNAYLLANLQHGHHPDTHPDFWSRFEGDPNRMPIPDESFQVWVDDTFWWVNSLGGVVVLASLMILAAALVMFYWHRRRKRAAVVARVN